MEEKALHPKLSIRLYTFDKCFGPGIAELLERVEVHKSLRAAAQSMSMAYSKAWTMVRRCEGALGKKLLDYSTGGRNGGGAALTEDGRRMLKAYRDYTAAVERCCAEEFTRHFGAFQKKRED